MTGRYRVVDLFSGTGAATQPWADAGHRVLRVDLCDGHDVRACLSAPVDCDLTLVWASPPCTEYSTARPCHIAKKHVDYDLWDVAVEFIRRNRPRYWIIENVVGAQRWHGRAPWHYGAWYLWGWYPPLGSLPAAPKKTAHRSPVERARVPAQLAAAVYERIIEDMTLRRLR